ncbi:MAG: hypothetical protein KJ579_09405, partial [Verrucomicrobia bacterium]|nr:hypothetical protein [Verrucomicrobiota bacterium]
FSSDHLDHSLAVSIHPGLEDHVRKLRKAKMRCAAHALALFGRAVIEAYGSVDAYPEAHAMKIIASLKRGSRIKAKWVESGPARSWEVLELAIRLICRSLAQYCYHEVDRRNKEERADITLYAQLKKPQALDDLWQELRSERQVSFKELVTPQ